MPSTRCGSSASSRAKRLAAIEIRDLTWVAEEFDRHARLRYNPVSFFPAGRGLLVEQPGCGGFSSPGSPGVSGEDPVS